MDNKKLVGRRFGRLLVIEKVDSVNYRSRFLCRCDCGNEKLVLGQSLLNGHVRSCGCLLSERSRERITSYNESIGNELHAETKTRLFAIWEGIKTRCFKETHHSYKNYGGRGVSMCDEWRNSFIAFRDWSMANGYSDSLSIDRIDPRGDYCPENCRWADNITQGRNKDFKPRGSVGVVGVSFNKRSNKFVAYLNGKHLGTFVTLEDAKKAREDAEKLI